MTFTAAVALWLAACGNQDAADPVPADGSADWSPPSTEPPPFAVEPADAVYRVIATSCGTGVEGVATAAAVTNTLAATVAHTFDGAASVAVEAVDGTRRDVDVVWIDPDRDLALLALPAPTPAWLPLGTAEPGTAVSIVSAADTAVAYTKPAELVRYRPVALDGVGWRSGIQLDDAVIERGDSGAPVVGPDGTLLGIVFATDRGTDSGWAIAAEELGAALAQPTDGPLALSC